LENGCNSLTSRHFVSIEELQAQLITGKAAQDELDSLLKSGVLPKAVYEEMRRLIRCEWQEQKRHWESIIAARMSLTPKLAITLNRCHPPPLTAGRKGALNEACGSEFSQKKLCKGGYKPLMSNC